MVAFVQVAEHSGFAPAARFLGLSTSAISRQVMELEDWLEIQLLNRTTRHVSLTDAGRDYLLQCKELVAGMDDLEARSKDQLTNPHGRILMTAPVFMGKQLLGPLLPGFCKQYPDVSIDLHLLDRVISLVDEGFDLALRIGELSDSSLVARKLGEFNISLVATPSYLKRAGIPKTVDDLKHHNCLIDTVPQHGNRWPVGLKSAIRVKGNITVNDGELVRELARSGTGIALLPDFFVVNDIANGQLVSILKNDIRKIKAGVYLAYPQTRHLSLAVRMFIDYAVKHGTPFLLKTDA